MLNSEILKILSANNSSLLNKGSKIDFKLNNKCEKEHFSSKRNESFSSENHQNLSFDLEALPNLTNSGFSSPQTNPTSLDISLNPSSQKLGEDLQTLPKSQKKSLKNLDSTSNSLFKAPIKKKNHCRTKCKTEKNIYQIKRLLAILKNWTEVCKTIPENQQASFREKILNYVQKNVFPNVSKEKFEENSFSKENDSFYGLKTNYDFYEKNKSLFEADFNAKNEFNQSEFNNLFIWENNNNLNLEEFGKNQNFWNSELIEEDDFRYKTE